MRPCLITGEPSELASGSPGDGRRPVVLDRYALGDWWSAERVRSAGEGGIEGDR